MSRFRVLVAGLGFVLAFVAYGYDGGDDYLKWMRYNTSGAIWNKANWYDPETTKTLVAPVEGKKYYVPSGIKLRTPTTSSSPRVTDFPGDVLAIAGTFETPDNYPLLIKELWMLPGFLWSPQSSLTMRAEGSIVRVKGTSDNKSYMRPFLYKTFLMIWNQNFYGDTTSYLVFDNARSGTNAKTGKFDRESAYASYLKLTGDWSQFYGTAQITTNNYVEVDAPGYRTFGGSLYINGGYFCFKSNSGEYQLRELKMDNGAELRCYGESGIDTRCVYTVSDLVTFSGQCYLFYEGDLPFGRTPVIKLGETAAANPPNLAKLGLSPYSCGGNIPDGVNLAIDDNGDGTKTIVLVREDITIISEGQTLTSDKTSGTESYGVLQFEDNTQVYFEVPLPNYEGSVVHCVTNRLELLGTTYVGLSTLPTNDAITVFRLSDAAAAAADQINLNRIQFNPKLMVEDLPGNPHAVLVYNDDGTVDVQMVWDPMKHMIVSNHGYLSAQSAFNPANTAYWADGELPTPTYNGTVFAHGILTIINNSSDYPNMRILCWPFKIANAQHGDFRPHTSHLTMKGLYYLGSASMSDYSGSYPTDFHCPIYFKNQKELETMYFYVRDGRVLRLYEPFNGDYDVFTRIDIDAGMISVLELIAPNTNFYGRITVTSGSNFTPVALILHDGRNLGGPYGRDDGYGWKSFEVDNYMVVSNVEDVVFDEPTRGMYVKKGANLSVVKDTKLEIDVPITYGGEIRKNGPGMLVLGAEAKFADASGNPVTTPVEGSNVLKVVSGSLCIAHTNALEGVAAHLADGTQLVLNPELESRHYGAISCRDGSALTADGKLKVVFDSNYFPADLRVDCGIVTVPAARADDYEFDYPTELNGRAVTLNRRENPNGSITFYLSVAGKPGFCIYFEQEQ